MSNPSLPRGIEVQSLDLLRGVMPVMVFGSHAAIWTGCMPQLRALFIGGGLAVDVFIFVSGFLMLWHYQDREDREPWQKPGTWMKFWIRRFFRLAPLYWLLLLITFSFLGNWLAWSDEFYRLNPPSWMDGLHEWPRVDQSLSPANVLSHYLFIFGVIPRFASNNPLPDWSIGLEMQFYLVFPFLALSIRKLGWPVMILALSAIWWVCLRQIHVGLLTPPGPWGWFPMPTFLPLRIGVFLSGMLIAYVLSGKTSFRSAMVYALIALIFAGWHNKYLLLPVAVFVVWEIIIRCPRRPKWLERPVRIGVAVLESKPIQFIADCSYGVYLWHILVQLVVLRLCVNFGMFDGRTHLERFALLVLMALPLVYLVSWVSYCWIERPAIQLGKAVLKKIKKGGASGP